MFPAVKQIGIALGVLATDAIITMPTATISTDADPIVVLAREFGFPIALICYFVYEGWKREKRMALRINDLEAFAKKELLGIVRQNDDALKDVATSNIKVAESIANLSNELARRPCVVVDEARKRLEDILEEELRIKGGKQ